RKCRVATLFFSDTPGCESGLDPGAVLTVTPLPRRLRIHVPRCLQILPAAIRRRSDSPFFFRTYGHRVTGMASEMVQTVLSSLLDMELPPPAGRGHLSPPSLHTGINHTTLEPTAAIVPIPLLTW